MASIADDMTFQTARDIFILRICLVASMTWAVYDAILNILQEIEVIWKSERSAAKYLYLILRYHGTFTLIFFVAASSISPPSRDVCDRILWAVALNPFIAFGAAEGLIQIKISALSSRSHNARILSTISALVLMAQAIWMMINWLEVELSDARARVHPALGCLTFKFHSKLMPPLLSFIIVGSIHNSIKFILICVKVHQLTAGSSQTHARRGLRFYRNLANLENAKPIIKTLLVHDGVLFFLCDSAALLLWIITFIVFRGRPTEWAGFPIALASMVVIATRIFMNLRTSDPEVTVTGPCAVFTTIPNSSFFVDEEERNRAETTIQPGQMSRIVNGPQKVHIMHRGAL